MNQLTSPAPQTLPAVVIPDTSKEAERAQRMLAFAKGFAVTTPTEYELAAEELQSLKRKRDSLEAQRVSITKPINAGVKLINELFGKPIDYLDSAIGAMKTAMLVYSTRQAAIAAAEKKRLEEAAAAEQKRLAEEASKLQAAGKTDEAEAAQLAADLIVAPAPTAAIPTARGISTAKILDWQVIDRLAFLRHVVENAETQPELLDYVIVDAIRMRKRCAAGDPGWPGILVGTKDSMRVR
jgi:hypothetical protein